MCTGIKLTAENNNIIYARTLEFGMNIDSQILFIPRSYTIKGTGPSGNPDGLSWATKFAAIGTNAAGLDRFVDGINEKGLAGGLFYFPDYAKYQNVSGQEASKSIGAWELLTWILTNFESVEEVKNNISTIKVSQAIFKAWNMIPPVHAIIHDTTGASLVIEYLDGTLVLTDNKIGVFTNSPSFDWHITNLRNYVNLSATNVPKIELNNINLTPLGQGSGMIGLPGDFTSPSRFIRAVAYTQSLVPSANETSAIKQAFHLLNLFDIPYGSVRQQDADTTTYEYTQWTSAIDLHNKRYYISTFENRNITVINLFDFEFDSQKAIQLKLSNDEQIFKMQPK